MSAPAKSRCPLDFWTHSTNPLLSQPRPWAFVLSGDFTSALGLVSQKQTLGLAAGFRLHCSYLGGSVSFMLIPGEVPDMARQHPLYFNCLVYISNTSGSQFKH